MKKTHKIFPYLLFAALLFAGWHLDNSPINQSFTTVKKSNEKIKQVIGSYPPGSVEPGYISANQHKIDVKHYFLNIDLHPKKRLLIGDVTITGKILDKNLKQLDLNFYDNLKISSLKLNGNNTEFLQKGTRLSIPLVRTAPDTFNLRIKYEGTPKHVGFAGFVFAEMKNHNVVYNLDEPEYSSTWFPCNDLPSDKALLDIKITSDSSQVSASNGKLMNVTTKGSRRTYYWKTVYPISTYLICLYSSDYVRYSDKYISLNKADTMDIDYFVFDEQLKDAKTDFKDTPNMIRYFAGTFGEYPFIKEKYGVAEFLWQMGAMETQTLTGIGSNFISGRNFFSDMLVHELAHHWFGDAVGPKTWKDIWLNEGFASYCEALYSEHQSGASALQSTMMSKFHDDFKGTLYNPKDLFGSTVYDKGAWVLNMLRWEVGDSTFFKILRNYFDTYKYKSASTEDFKKICEKVSNKNLDQFFNQWVFEGRGILKLDYKWKTEKINNTYNVIMNLAQTQTGYDVYHFPLQVEVEFGDRTKITKTFYVEKRQTLVEFIADKKPVDILPDPNNRLLAEYNNLKKSNE